MKNRALCQSPRWKRRARHAAAIDFYGVYPQNAGMGKIDPLGNSADRRGTARNIFRHLFLFVLALAAALFLMLCNQVSHFTIRQHSFHPAPGLLLLAAMLMYLLLLGIWTLSGRGWEKLKGLGREEALTLDLPTYAPLALLLLAPLALLHYLTRDDLAERLGLFALAIVAAMLYLKLVCCARTARPERSSRRALLDAFLDWPLTRRIVVMAVLSLMLANAGARIMNRQGISFGGDEPHYLLIAHSLLKDGDLDLANNYQNGDYRFFMPPQVQLRPHTVPGKKEATLYSFHSLGIAIILLPFYALGLLLGKGALIFLVRFGMSLIGAFLGIQIYLYAREAWQREKLALGLWVLVAFTTPIFFYSIHVYPEIVVAAGSLFIFRRLRHARSIHALELAGAGFLLASFVWFHALKYFFIQGPLFIFVVWTVWKSNGTEKRFRRLAAFLIPAGVCFAAYFYFQNAIYGSFNPTAVSWQGAMDGRQTMSFLKNIFAGIPFHFRWETLAGYFLDQRDGLLFYAPIYAFAFIGAATMIGAKFRDRYWLLFIAAPYILASAFLTQRTGHAPQARPLVAVIWVLAVFMGGFVAEKGKHAYRLFFLGAAGFSFFTTWMLCRNPFALYQETTFGTTERAGRLFVDLSHLHFYLPSLLPSFIKIDGGSWPQNFIWMIALVLFITAYFLFRGRDIQLDFFKHAVLAIMLPIVFFIMVVLFPRPVLVLPRTATMATGEAWTFYSLSLTARMGEPGNFALLQDDRDYDFYFAAPERLGKLEVVFGSLHGDYVIQVRMADEKAFAVKTRREVLSRIVASPAAYRWRGKYLYRVSVRLDKKSAVRTAVTPYVFVLRPVR